jgi:hypothetical protein
MQVYHYDPVTKLYTGQGPADIDPEATKQAGQDVYLLPGSATFTAPPDTGEHQAAAWNGQAWALVHDYRGYVCYDPANGQPHPGLPVGEEPPAGWPSEPPPADYRYPYYEDSAWHEDIEKRASSDISKLKALAREFFAYKSADDLHPDGSRKVRYDSEMRSIINMRLALYGPTDSLCAAILAWNAAFQAAFNGQIVAIQNAASGADPLAALQAIEEDINYAWFDGRYGVTGSEHSDPDCKALQLQPPPA